MTPGTDTTVDDLRATMEGNQGTEGGNDVRGASKRIRKRRKHHSDSESSESDEESQGSEGSVGKSGDNVKPSKPSNHSSDGEDRVENPRHRHNRIRYKTKSVTVQAVVKLVDLEGVLTEQNIRKFQSFIREMRKTSHDVKISDRVSKAMQLTLDQSFKAKGVTADWIGVQWRIRNFSLNCFD